MENNTKYEFEWFKKIEKCFMCPFNHTNVFNGVHFCVLCNYKTTYNTDIKLEECPLKISEEIENGE